MDFKLFGRWFYMLGDRHDSQADDAHSGNYVYYSCYRFPIDDIHPETAWSSRYDRQYFPNNSLPTQLEVIRVKWPKLEYALHCEWWYTSALTLQQDEDPGLIHIFEGQQSTNARDNAM